MCDTLITYKTTVKLNVISNQGNEHEGQIHFFPNPSRDIVWFTGDVSLVKSLFLLDISGKRIPVSLKGNALRLDGFAPGVYGLVINGCIAGKLVIADY
ncbi:MAG: hypothetical protein NZM35_07830 [Chitinophagales bacterium]|nr:hypothetical protein [Chitinophagales bacterium]MDW8419666.1 hypothetical protein [Chitinophagales bacterium]